MIEMLDIMLTIYDLLPSFFTIEHTRADYRSTESENI
jgi:hypothetical protein